MTGTSDTRITLDYELKATQLTLADAAGMTFRASVEEALRDWQAKQLGGYEKDNRPRPEKEE